MANPSRSLLRPVLGLLLALGLAQAPLRAQLDPRLQASTTDFLDLYQQSSSQNPKPEIVSVFDFSKSMSSLMFHPLYRNDDVNDQDDNRFMKFVLNHGGVTPAEWYLQIGAMAWGGTCASPGSENVSGLYIGPTSARLITENNGPVVTCEMPYKTYMHISAFSQGTDLSKQCKAVTVFTNIDPYMTNGPYKVDVERCSYTKGSNFEFTDEDGNDIPPGKPVIKLVPEKTSYAWHEKVDLVAYLKHTPIEGEAHLDKEVGFNYIGYYFPAASWTEVKPSVDGKPGIYKSVYTHTMPGYGGGSTWHAPITMEPPDPRPGDTVTLSSYLIKNDSNSTGMCFWVRKHPSSRPDLNPDFCGDMGGGKGGVINVLPQTSELGVKVSAKYTIPEYCLLTGDSVTVTLDATQGARYSSGITYPGVLSGRTDDANPDLRVLRKPDGSPVTSADADAAAGPLFGTEKGTHSVLNWIRAASHVRLRDPATGRVVDIPIPWKNIDPTSAGNPLSAQRLTDLQDKITLDTHGLPSHTFYGSGQPIETDTCYLDSLSPKGVFSPGTDSSGVPWPPTSDITEYLNGVSMRPSYIAWLFNGKYQSADPAQPNYTTDSALAGKYVIFDALNNSLAANQSGHLNWGQAFGPAGTAWGPITVPNYDPVGNYLGTVAEDASNYRLPALTRLQAIKQAAIQTWINHQADVLWAFRELDTAYEAGGGLGASLDNNSSTTRSAADPTTTYVAGLDSGWTVLNNTPAQGSNAANGNSVTGMKRIAGLFASGDTPLTYAMARTLAQFNDPKSVFNPFAAANSAQCANQFLLLFTDGADNNGLASNNANTDTPYLTGTGPDTALSALSGNQVILANPNRINRSGANWNLFTFAGMAAHLSDPALGTLGTDYMAAADPGANTTSGSPSTFLPYAVKKRNGTLFDKDHRITTMTFGVSLGGNHTQDTSPKRSLYLAAVAGDPNTVAGNLADFTPFDPATDWIPNPSFPSDYPRIGKKKEGAVYFFDAQDPAKLSTCMDLAIRAAISAGGNNATASPNLPFVGASLGNQVYLGQFLPPKYGGVLWPGDLLMFGTKEVNGAVAILDKAGHVATTLDKANAQWAASDALYKGSLWSERITKGKLWTRLPGTDTLKAFTDQGDDYEHATTGLKNYVGIPNLTSGSPAQKAIIQLAAGGNLTGPLDGGGRPTTNRLDIMGDVINSAPAALEYNWNDVKNSLGAYPRLAAVGGNRFRIILVGTNQGWLHAFGEVTKQERATVGDTSTPVIVKGDVEELWSFMPTDFLAHLDYLSNSTNSHRTMVDGSPAIYHLDLPPSGGGAGNGVVDVANPKERALAVIGLRKGGRSYYALDIKNPFSPALKWSLVPDEADQFPATRILAGGPTLAEVTAFLKTWGFSSATPAIGRVQFSGVIRDAVFLGGGASAPEVEANFPDAAAKPTPLGRSVMAVDVWSGAVLAAADLTDAAVGGPSVGPVATGLVPFEYILGSGMAQRAYFLDYEGGLWAWGAKEVAAAAPYTDFRVDSSELSSWKLRKVYQDPNDSASGRGARYTTLPAPFRVGNFPGVGKSGSAAPAAVGVAMVSGDRNNPLDYLYSGTNLAPDHHRLTVVFDRQDSRAWGLDTAAGPDSGITDASLANFTANAVGSTPADPCVDAIFQQITPGCPDYYLAPHSTGVPASPLTPQFGYYVNFPSASGGFIPKGINPPLVVAGSLYYSYFKPTAADPCTGGAGTTLSWLITDALNPLVEDTRSGGLLQSGQTNKDLPWQGVASDYIALGTRSILQGGTVATGGAAPGGGILTTAAIKTTTTLPGNRYVKPRVWRTVH